MLKDSLNWYPEFGMGWHPKPPMVYNGNYFEKYIELDNTPMGESLTKARIDMVKRYYMGGVIIDVGIGGGRFVREMDCFGHDVNTNAYEWLIGEKRYLSPFRSQVVEALCFWDSLEHIPHPDTIIQCSKNLVFVSMPIYESGEHVLKSKHYKPGEHIWYWTRDGLIKFFRRHGFNLLEHNDMESKLGREGIESFAFKRI